MAWICKRCAGIWQPEQVKAWHYERCPGCLGELEPHTSKRTGRRSVQQALKSADERDYQEYKRELRRQERQQTGEDVSEAEGVEWLRADSGYPLGRGFPPGRSLREDGQSHRQAWEALVRRDPCAYCGAPASTVDHIDAKPWKPRNVWVNLTGACETCNRSKGDTPLLLWLRHRRVLVRPARR